MTDCQRVLRDNQLTRYILGKESYRLCGTDRAGIQPRPQS